MEWQLRTDIRFAGHSPTHSSRGLPSRGRLPGLSDYCERPRWLQSVCSRDSTCTHGIGVDGGVGGGSVAAAVNLLIGGVLLAGLYRFSVGRWPAPSLFSVELTSLGSVVGLAVPSDCWAPTELSWVVVAPDPLLKVLTWAAAMPARAHRTPAFRARRQGPEGCDHVDHRGV